MRRVTTLEPYHTAPRSATHDDLGLARRASRGETEARRALVLRLEHRVRRTIGYMRGLGADSDDVVQIALVRIVRYAASYRGDSTIERWADRIAVRAALTHIEDQRGRPRLAADDEMNEQPEMGAVELDEMVFSARVRERLGAALANLSFERRTAVVLHHIMGYEAAEVAEMTDTALNTVRDRLATSRKILKKSIMSDPVLRDWAGRRPR